MNSLLSLPHGTRILSSPRLTGKLHCSSSGQVGLDGYRAKDPPSRQTYLQTVALAACVNLNKSFSHSGA